mmetsp:Transcript_7760/g.19015  ORF Transcript_7760/g.19015 Transcript_7760/m.19015 type:complete len:347 (+) Transcript_7760:229-1269(+)
MKASTTERLAAFFFCLLAGTVWNSIGANAVVTPNSNSAILGSIQSKIHVPMQSKSASLLQEHINHALLLSLRMRGGEMAAKDDEEENSGLIAGKLRNLIRNLLQISDDKVPLVSGLLRTFFGTIESLTGMDLLPAPEVEEETKSKKKAKSKSKSKTTVSDDDDGEKESTKTKKKNKPKKKEVSKKTSAATKKHLATSIKSTNPNYRIQKELKAFLKSPPDNLSVQVGSNIRLWIVTILGAKDTIYEGEIFKLRIEFPKDYPTVPPSVYFLKKHMPIHEHVYTNGDICLSLLGNGWRPTMSAQSIAVSILSILSSAQKKCLPMDNANHAGNKPGQYQKDWVYHDDNC